MEFCYDLWVIFYSILVTDVLRFIVETSFNFSFEISLKPTSIEVLENPSLDENEDIDLQE